MPEIGKTISKKYHWISRDVPICLFLDNIGGHGTGEAATKYLAMLKDDFNVICIHQRPHLPATNLLDLGVWMDLQDVVEKLHFCK